MDPATKIELKIEFWVLGKGISEILVNLPVSLIFLIAIFIVSAMYIFPLSSKVRPFGWFILASLEWPSTCPEYPSADPETSLGLLTTNIEEVK